MKKLFIILLFIFCNPSISLADKNEKITIQDIENIFFKDRAKYPMIYEKKETNIKIDQERIKKQKESHLKRARNNKSIAKCLYDPDYNSGQNCNAKVIKTVFTYSEKSAKKRPGDIFYALDAIRPLISGYFNFVKSFDYYEGDEIVPGMYCGEFKYGKYLIKKKYKMKNRAYCSAFKKSTYKKIEKFKLDPSNEKILGHKLTKYINNRKMLINTEKRLGTNNYALLGDMLNAVTGDVKKNKLSPGLEKRRLLLKKYSYVLRVIKNKINKNNYKSIDKDLSKLSKIFDILRTLPTDNSQIISNFDNSINLIIDTNTLIKDNVLSLKKDEEIKLPALASINFMEFLIDPIINSIPEKYYTETKKLDPDFFNEYDLEELENIINSMIKKNNEIKTSELKKSINLIEKFINPSDILNELDNLGMKIITNRELTKTDAGKIAKQQIVSNLDSDILKSAKKVIQDMDRDALSDITKEISEVASEVSSSSSVKEATSNRAVDREYGGQSLKNLIGAGVINR